MLTVLGLSLVFIILCFGFVIWFGAPYLPTLSDQLQHAMELVDLQPGDTLLELGCGDGKVLMAAAQRGWQAVGYELNPLLVIICKLRCWRYRKLVRVKWANIWTQEWPPAQGIFVFLLPKYMPKLDKKVMQYVSTTVNPTFTGKSGLKLVSFAFSIPGRKPVAKKGGVLLYSYN